MQSQSENDSKKALDQYCTVDIRMFIESVGVSLNFKAYFSENYYPYKAPYVYFDTEILPPIGFH